VSRDQLRKFAETTLDGLKLALSMASSTGTGRAGAGSAGADARSDLLSVGVPRLNNDASDPAENDDLRWPHRDGELTGKHTEDGDTREHDRDPAEPARACLRHDVAVADGCERQNSPPERVAAGRELRIGFVLRLVGRKGREQDYEAGDDRDLPEACGEAPQAGGGEQQPAPRAPGGLTAGSPRCR
jgi:hypothetical protein